MLSELRRLFGAARPPGALLQGAPGLALSCQSLQGQSRGERDHDYLKDIFSGGGVDLAAAAEAEAEAEAEAAAARRRGEGGGGGSTL